MDGRRFCNSVVDCKTYLPQHDLQVTHTKAPLRGIESEIKYPLKWSLSQVPHKHQAQRSLHLLAPFVMNSQHMLSTLLQHTDIAVLILRACSLQVPYTHASPLLDAHVALRKSSCMC